MLEITKRSINSLVYLFLKAAYLCKALGLDTGEMGELVNDEATAFLSDLERALSDPCREPELKEFLDYVEYVIDDELTESVMLESPRYSDTNGDPVDHYIASLRAYLTATGDAEKATYFIMQAADAAAKRYRDDGDIPEGAQL
jgi:hypothetical protein